MSVAWWNENCGFTMQGVDQCGVVERESWIRHAGYGPEQTCQKEKQRVTVLSQKKQACWTQKSSLNMYKSLVCDMLKVKKQIYHVDIKKTDMAESKHHI